MFESRFAAAFDPERDVELQYPRIQPSSAPDGIELQFALYRGGKRVYGFGCLGTISQEADHSDKWTYGFNKAGQLDSLLKLKISLAPDLSDGSFLMYLADGLTTVFADGFDTPVRTTYELTLSDDALAFARLLEGFHAESGDQVILCRRTVDPPTVRQP